MAGTEQFGTDVRVRETPATPDCPPSPIQDEPKVDAAAWAVHGDMFYPTPTTTQKLPAGFYSCEWSQRGSYFRALDESAVDNLMRLPDPTIDMLMTEFITFWERVPKFAARWADS